MSDPGSSREALSRPSGGSFRSRLRWAGLLSALLAGSGIAWAIFGHVPAPPDVGATGPWDTVLDEPVVMNPGYVGAQACAACHAARVTDCQSTTHFRTFRTPDPAAMPTAFDSGRQTYTSQLPGL